MTLRFGRGGGSLPAGVARHSVRGVVRHRGRGCRSVRPGRWGRGGDRGGEQGGGEQGQGGEREMESFHKGTCEWYFIVWAMISIVLHPCLPRRPGNPAKYLPESRATRIGLGSCPRDRYFIHPAVRRMWHFFKHLDPTEPTTARWPPMERSATAGLLICGATKGRAPMMIGSNQLRPMLKSALLQLLLLLLVALRLGSPTLHAANEKLSGDLAKAIRGGDLDAVKAAVDAGADINALDERKMPPIGAASLLGKTDIINYLAEKGADVNRNDGFGYTPLMCAAQRGQAGAVKALLRHGADPALKGGNNTDALFYAAPKGPADPLFDEKTAVVKILNDAIAAQGKDLPALAPQAPPAAIPTAAIARAPVPAKAMVAVEQSPIVTKNPDGTLGVLRKDGTPVDGIKLSVHDQEIGSPSLVVAPNGAFHVVYMERHGPPFELSIYHRSSTDSGKTWTEAKNLSEDMPDIKVGRCQAIAAAKGRIYAVWRAGLGRNFQASVDPTGAGHCNLMFRVLEGGQWSKIKPVHPPGSVDSQNDGSLSWFVALDGAGTPQVVWNSTPNKWHDELVDIRKGSGTDVYRFQFNGIGNGLVFQSALEGANASAPREAMLTPITGVKGDTAHPPSCNGLDTLNGYVDAAGGLHFIARVTSTVDDSWKGKNRYQLFESGKPGAYMDLPDLSYHAWRDIPTLLVDASGKKHVLVLYPFGEHPSVRDYLIGTDLEPTIVRQTAGTKGTLDGFQAYQGPGGRMIAVMQMNDTGERGEGDDFVSVSTGDGKWSPPVNVTNNSGRRSFASKVINPVSNVAVSHTYYPGPAAAAIDNEGHLLLLMINNERGLFGNQVGIRYYGGSSSTPKLQFLRF